MDFFAYSPNFLGGVTVAVGNVTGNGDPDSAARMYRQVLSWEEENADAGHARSPRWFECGRARLAAATPQ
jgi:hypothetical protein